ncbi:EscU/YscU/HrcU family type III secretion system export apparatus switch protein [Caldinitratiruptor microaerophilus]|uniref:Flagellar biosynthesis protein n=1 Tax=Caldinitratiruptor microaerophilus TaxID=671077 RepID=A0AA35G6N8_9FIRM|nr:EscU/YscU/HrcU family type III secretion system export apparatus switch protein [Caldinitratiruptor microaerophilus]BDG61636.1 hypothetical protein caldi_27260 [Caldinitratiruptor microaerophilus]
MAAHQDADRERGSEERAGHGGMPPARRVREAAALRYDPGQEAPQVVAAGRGRVADRIVETAAEAGVPIRREPGLAAALVALGAGAIIPPALYEAVAEVLLWVARQDAERARRWLG